MLIVYSILTVCLLIASIYDATIKKIPNWISLVILVSGLSWNYFFAEGLGLRDSGAGFLAGFLLMLFGYIFASMGAGDVKLMAAIGSVVGFNSVLDVVLYSYIIMFVGAIFFIIVKGDFVKLSLRYKALVYGLFSGILSYQKPDSSEAAGYRMPLAPAISLATLYVLYPKICNSGAMFNLCHF
ncbi:MAG: A24 family peptidase [Methylococcaceae bacterium]